MALGPVIRINIHLVEIVGIIAPNPGRYDLAGGRLHQADPGHLESAMRNQRLADLGEKLVAVPAQDNRLVDLAQGRVESGEPGDLLLVLLQHGDVRADGDILAGFALRIHEGHDGRVHPVVGTVLRPVLDFPFPDLALPDGRPHVPEDFLGMITRADDAVVLPDEFLPRVLGNRAELVVDVSDLPLRIRGGHDRVLVQGGLEVADFLERRLELIVGLHGRGGMVLGSQGRPME